MQLSAVADRARLTKTLNSVESLAVTIIVLSAGEKKPALSSSLTGGVLTRPVSILNRNGKLASLAADFELS